LSAYGFDPGSGAVTVSWPTGAARRTAVVGVLPGQVDAGAADDLVMALDGLSEAMWDTYVHPAGQFGDPDEPNTEAWRWDGERKAFPDALAAVRHPQLPDHGMLMVSYCRVEESGHRVGRAVHALDLGEDFIAVITGEVQTEQAAIEAAESGELSGRAGQAVALSRVGASPTQVQVAWQALLTDPLGCHDDLLTRFEPSAAAIAAAGCLRCAARLAAQVSDEDWTDVLIEADNIEPLPVVTPTTVLALLDQGAGEREAVTRLLVEAHAVAEGELSDPEHLFRLVAQLQRLREAGVGGDDLALRLTPLDPRRPARDLLEDLLTGIDGCFTLWREFQDDPADPDEDGDEEESLRAYQAWYDNAAREFCTAVTAAMHQTGPPS
jgi:hypothetical protein